MQRTSLCAMAIAIAATISSSGHAQSERSLTAPEQAMLDRISADSMRGHLSFIASDLLEGRDTPS